MSGAWVYVVKCADGSYYTGLTKLESPEAREWQHNAGIFPDAYTASRRPVSLAYSEHFERVIDAIDAERRIKGWSRAKKEAMIAREWDRLPGLSKRKARQDRS